MGPDHMEFLWTHLLKAVDLKSHGICIYAVRVLSPAVNEALNKQLFESSSLSYLIKETFIES